jgi:hypothetical protein
MPEILRGGIDSPAMRPLCAAHRERIAGLSTSRRTMSPCSCRAACFPQPVSQGTRRNRVPRS